MKAAQMLQMHGAPIAAFLWTSFALSIVAMGQHNWITYGDYTEGLFIRVNTAWAPGPTADPAPVTPLPYASWLEAVRAFMIMGLVFTNLAAFGCQVMVACYKKLGKYLKFASYCSCSGAWSFLIAIIVYTATVQNGYHGIPPQSEPFNYGVGFILTWISAGFGLIGSTIFWITLGKLDGKEEPNCQCNC